MINPKHDLSIGKQAVELGISRSSVLLSATTCLSGRFETDAPNGRIAS